MSSTWDKRGTSFLLQTITSAMSTLTPPVSLEDPANQSRMDYVLEVSSSPDFDYPPVSHQSSLPYIFAFLHAAKTKRGSHLRARNNSSRPSRARDRKSPRDNRLRRHGCITNWFLNREASTENFARAIASRNAKENASSRRFHATCIIFRSPRVISIISRNFDRKAVFYICAATGCSSYFCLNFRKKYYNLSLS